MLQPTWSLAGWLKAWWSWERIVILFGFLLAIIGAVGGQIYLAPAIQRVTKIEADIAAQRAKMKITRAALAFDDVSKQLSGALFLVKRGSTENDASRQTIAELINRMLRHRHDEVRTMISQLAIAGEIDFGTVSSAYEALVGNETREFTLGAFQAANDYDADLTSKVAKDQTAGGLAIIALRRARFAAQNESDWRRRALAAISLLGSALILVAALKASGHAPAIESKANIGAVELLEAALVEARARLDKARHSAAAATSLETDSRV